MPAKRQTLKNGLHPFGDVRQELALRQQLENIQQDLANLRAALVAVTAKLDLDVGVTDVNYASTTNPAALFTQP